jgi:hypothetical protein
MRSEEEIRKKIAEIEDAIQYVTCRENFVIKRALEYGRDLLLWVLGEGKK